jgi:hypothetical protein
MDAARFDSLLVAIFACVAGMAILLVGVFRHWSIPWWLYVLAFSLCLAMPL